MEESTHVTIGLVCYNADKFLFNSINSILNQDYKNFELIITNDGSTDNTFNIINSFNDDRIKFLNYNANMGLAFRLNEQINLSRCKYFMRMDADDIMFSNRLRIQLNFLQSNQDIDVIGSYAIVFNEFNTITGLRKSKEYFDKKNIFFNIPFIHPSIMGKTSWFLNYEYNSNFSGCEDLDLWFRSFNNSKFGLIKEPLLFYRDPLKLRFSIYFNRSIIIIKLLNMYFKSKDVSFFFFLKCVFYIIFKNIIHSILYLFNLMPIIIKRRNKVLSNKDYTFFSNMLNSILK